MRHRVAGRIFFATCDVDEATKTLASLWRPDRSGIADGRSFEAKPSPDSVSRRRYDKGENGLLSRSL